MHGQEGVAAALLAPGTRPALPQPGVCVGWGGCSACQRGGRPVCFGGLAAVGWLLGNLSAAVWACLGSGSHRQSETRLCSTPEPAGRDPGTQAGLGVVGRAGWGHRVSPGPSWVRLRGVSGEGCVCVCGREEMAERVLGRRPSWAVPSGWDLRSVPLTSP